MKYDDIKDYVEKYKGQYSDEAIERQLKNSGASSDEINRAMNDVKELPVPAKIPDHRRVPSESHDNISNSTLPFILVLLGWFIPIIGLIMIILGIVLAHKARKIKKDGLSMAALIMGYFYILVTILLIIFAVFFFYSLAGETNYNNIIDNYGSDTLLPNRLDLSGNIDGNPSNSVAKIRMEDNSNIYNNAIVLAFKYNGAKRTQLNENSIENSNIVMVLNEKCNAKNFKNLDTKQEYSIDNPLTFLNGQSGIAIFECSESTFLVGDIIEGKIQLFLNDPKTGFNIASSGDVRLTIEP